MKVNKDGTKNQHSDQIQTQKGIYVCGTVVTVQYLPSGEHKNYDHVSASNSTNTKHIPGE